jgi:hypothetical protein
MPHARMVHISVTHSRVVYLLFNLCSFRRLMVYILAVDGFIHDFMLEHFVHAASVLIHFFHRMFFSMVAGMIMVFFIH